MSKKARKNVAKARAAVEQRPYALHDAVPLLQKVKFAKFDETVDLTMRLGVDPKHADQMVRGTVVLPHGLGKTKRVAVITSRREGPRGAKQRELSLSAAKTLSKKFRRKAGPTLMPLIATPDMMKSSAAWARCSGRAA